MFINESNKVIELTKIENREAHTYGTHQYEALQEIRKAYPGFRVVIKERKKNVDRLKGLDVPYMKNYILKHHGKESEVWTEFCQLRGLDKDEEKQELSAAVSFGELRMWFLNTYPEVENLSKYVDELMKKVKKERAEKKAQEAQAKAAMACK